jgi:hypothetical protein
VLPCLGERFVASGNGLRQGAQKRDWTGLVVVVAQAIYTHSQCKSTFSAAKNNTKTSIGAPIGQKKRRKKVNIALEGIREESPGEQPLRRGLVGRLQARQRKSNRRLHRKARAREGEA